MYKYSYYRKNDYNVMAYDFDSITEFIDYLDKTPTNTKVWENSDLSSHDSDYSFCKTRTFKEAEELCKYGYHENFEKLVKLKLSLEKYIKIVNQRNRQFNDYVGYAPNVKAYLEGNPLSMFNKKPVEREHIDIYFNSANIASVSSDQIFNRGAISLCIVEILEKLGFSVGLKVFTMSSEGSQVHYVNLNLKKSGERLNIQKLFFPFCHPSFFRRLIFRIMEQTPDITSSWTYGYGRTCKNYLIREILDLNEKDIVICRPDEMHVYGNNIIEDANAMFNYINDFTNEKVQLEKIKR